MTIRFFKFCLVALITCWIAPQALAQANPQLLPYKTSLIAGGGTTDTFTAGAACPVSGKTATDTYGDGCLATEVKLTTPHYTAVDTDGNVYFSDGGNKLIRRIDAQTGVLSLVAGGAASNPASGTVCGAFTSTDWQGDGCLATAIKIGAPTGVAISPVTGDVYFADTGNCTVRKISKTTGVISNVAGDISGTGYKYGYVVNSTSGTVVAATGSTLDAPYGINFDAAGNLFITEEYKNAIFVVNTGSATSTINGVSVPAGTIAKIVGYRTPAAECINGTSGTNGCSYGKWTDSASAAASLVDAPYDLAVDASGNLFFANEYNPAIAKVTTAGIISTWAGKQASGTITNSRGLATSLYMGSIFGMTLDKNSNVYIADSVKGWIWRVDAANQGMYVFAGGASSVCSDATTSYGDGCGASDTKFTGTATGTNNYTSVPGPQGLAVDTNGSLILVDSSAGVIHKIALNTDFGTILAGITPTQNVNIHFGAGDSPAASAYTLTSGSANFTLGSATCTPNSDTTTDCLLPITANPSVNGAFTGTLHVVSTQGKSADFALKGTLELNQVGSTTVVQASPASTNPTTPVTLTAIVTGASSSAPVTGTVTFYDGSTQLGQPQTLTNGSASITELFAVGAHAITAVYDGNLYLNGSTSQATTVTSLNPGITFTAPHTNFTVTQGQTVLDAFTVTSVGSYTGAVSFACSGLPANTSCLFSPSSLVMSASGTSTVTLTILTTAPTTKSAALAPLGKPTDTGKGIALCVLPGALLLLAGLRKKKRGSLPVGLLLLIASFVAMSGLSGCGSGDKGTAGTPTGTYTVTVTAAGASGVSQTSTLTLVVTK